MRVVIDASIDPRLVEAFPDHHVHTLFDLGWQHPKDHVLVKQLECDVFVTADKGFEHEHDLKSLSFGIVIVHVARNKIAFYRPLFRNYSRQRRRSGPAKWFMFTVLPCTKALSRNNISI
jgi:hypothetical protein